MACCSAHPCENIPQGNTLKNGQNTIARELRGQKCPERGQKVSRLYLTGNFALNPKINVLHAVPGKFSK